MSRSGLRTRERLWFGFMLTLTTAVSIAACGGSDETDLDAAPPIPIEELPAEISAAFCTAVESCLGPVWQLFLAGEECEERFATALEDDLPRLMDAIDEGTVVYDGTEVEACVNQIVDSGCDVVHAIDHEDCLAALDGTLEEGEECESAFECEGVLYCNTNDSCPGVCSRPERAGGACREDGQCADGLACSDDTNRCIEPAREGEECGGASAPECAFGVVCIGQDEDAGTAGECMKPEDGFANELGEECGLSGNGLLCAPELSCVVTEVTLEGPSTECVEELGSGDDCNPGFPDPCPVDEYCAVGLNPIEGACTPLPEDGQACATAAFQQEATLCAAYHRCEDGTCRELQHLGGSCVTPEVCYSENCVDGGCAPGGVCE